MRTNCVNCGAAIDIDEQKCPFCGTSYFDLTDIDFTASDPVALRLKIPYCGSKALVTMLARPRLEEFAVNTDYVYAVGKAGERLASIPISQSVNVGVSFDAVAKPNKEELFRVAINELKCKEE